MNINFVQNENGNIVQKGTVTLNAQDLSAIVLQNPEASNLCFSFRQLSVCDDEEGEKGMVFIASQPFNLPT
jgi:hypothetical protein